MASWRLCSSCRGEIDFEQVYWECSVSTCARVARTGLFFCSVSCWEAHLPTMRHREAWAVEKRAPGEAAWRRQQAEEERRGHAEPARESHAVAPLAPQPAPRPVASGEAGRGGDGGRRVVAPEPAADDASEDILIVVSKLKKYIRVQSGMNTSDGVLSVLSEHLRRVCDRAIRHAAEDGRKTVLDRDFKAIL